MGNTLLIQRLYRVLEFRLNPKPNPTPSKFSQELSSRGGIQPSN
ncbi:hypothetical protein MC7420_6193 [Coleofasciculus chthonoplastes PCC 7420]|uniref:Uncharacterized protein n=1 Tax=Coleofasciculus chthonoplastes PCC 7420 TaxID=118168 RepID=B4VTR5_9CYAN|nr:hypothetical protein MC7420_6193 [Coleofasciculus chthonoplastes PCC 7420]